MLFKTFSAVAMSVHEREVMGSIPSAIDQSLKLVILAFSFGAQDFGYSTTTGRLVSG